MDDKIIELSHIQNWCVEQIRLLNNKILQLENKLQQTSSDISIEPHLNHTKTSEIISEISFKKKPDRSFLGLSKSKAFCTVIPKSTVDHKILLAEFGIDRDNKQTSIILIDTKTGLIYQARIRCAYQDRNKTRKLAPDALKPDIRILLEFKNNQETCDWFCSRLIKSVEEIGNDQKSSERVAFNYIGEKKFEIHFE